MNLRSELRRALSGLLLSWALSVWPKPVSKSDWDMIAWFAKKPQIATKPDRYKGGKQND
jgi:hypothetical protein